MFKKSGKSVPTIYREICFDLDVFSNKSVSEQDVKDPEKRKGKLSCASDNQELSKGEEDHNKGEEDIESKLKGRRIRR